MDLIRIGQSWGNYIQGSQETKKLMEYRLEKCDSCPHKKQMNALGEFLVTMINSEASTFKCGLCGCPLAGLTAHPGNSCKDNRWGPAGTESMY